MVKNLHSHLNIENSQLTNGALFKAKIYLKLAEGAQSRAAP
jgi:hypothetical protein